MKDTNLREESRPKAAVDLGPTLYIHEYQLGKLEDCTMALHSLAGAAKQHAIQDIGYLLDILGGVVFDLTEEIHKQKIEGLEGDQ